MAEREFVLVGVSHADERNTEEILHYIDNPVRHVYHERSKDATIHSWLKWASRSPTVAITTVLRTVSDADFDSECERAANELANEHGLTEVAEIGMRYSERIGAKPGNETLVEWMYVFSIPFFLGLLLTKTALFGVVFAVWSLPTLLLFGDFMNTQEFPRREEAMVENILRTDPQRHAGKEVVIIGEDHLSGVGGRLQAREYSVKSVWLNTLLQAEKE